MEYMVTCDLPSTLTPDFLELIPEQREIVDKMFQKGTLTSYILALDRSKLWITILGTNEEEVMEKLAKLPLMPYMRVEIYELAFHNAARVVLPAVSLN
ncbi:MAG: muconolactone Delta-isomerase family protein [Saprospiraceae bacterium]